MNNETMKVEIIEEMSSLDIEIQRLAKFSNVPGIASLVQELNKLLPGPAIDIHSDQTAELVETIRVPMLTLLDIPLINQIRIDGDSLADHVHQVLLEMAKLWPRNLECQVNFEIISENSRVYISTGEVFDLHVVCHYHHTRTPRYAPPMKENDNSKFLLHLLHNAPYHPKDVKHIRNCCEAKNIPLLDLRVAEEVKVNCVSIARPVRNLSPEMVSYLRGLGAVDFNGMPAPVNVVNIDLSSFPKFSAFLGRIKELSTTIQTMAAGNYIQITTYSTLASVAAGAMGYDLLTNVLVLPLMLNMMQFNRMSIRNSLENLSHRFRLFQQGMAHEAPVMDNILLDRILVRLQRVIEHVDEMRQRANMNEIPQRENLNGMWQIREHINEMLPRENLNTWQIINNEMRQIRENRQQRKCSCFSGLINLFFSAPRRPDSDDEDDSIENSNIAIPRAQQNNPNLRHRRSGSSFDNN